MIHLLDIDPGNWRIDLAVSEAQKPFVSDRAKLLARAYAYRARRSRAFLICADDLPVGMGLYYDEPELQSYDLSQMFIDARYQSRGYGKAAVRAILDELKADGQTASTIKSLSAILRETKPRENSTRASALWKSTATETRSSCSCRSKPPLCKGRWRGA